MYMPAVTVPMESGRVLRIHSPIHGPRTPLPVPWSLVAVIRDVDVPRRQTDRRHLSRAKVTHRGCSFFVSPPPLPSGWTLTGEIGRIAGEVGGKRRAEALSPTRRRLIAQKAAKARWAIEPRIIQ